MGTPAVFFIISIGKLLIQILLSMLLLTKLSRNIMLISSYIIRKIVSYIHFFSRYMRDNA